MIRLEDGRFRKLKGTIRSLEKERLRQEKLVQKVEQQRGVLAGGGKEKNKERSKERSMEKDKEKGKSIGKEK